MRCYAVGNVGVLRAARAVFRPVLRAARAVFRPVLRAARATFRPVLRAVRAVFRPVLRAVLRAVLLALRAVLRTVLRAFRAVFVAIVFLPFCFDVTICSFRVRFHRSASPDFAVAHGKSSHNSSGSLSNIHSNAPRLILVSCAKVVQDANRLVGKDLAKVRGGVRPTHANLF
jgi:hypothetical protein